MFTDVTEEYFNQQLAEVLYQDIKQFCSTKEAGHCLKISDINHGLMIDICKRLQQDSGAEHLESYVLSKEKKESYEITPGELVARRNASNLGVLLVFIPPSLRTAAEDSFGPTTFDETYLPSNAYQRLRDSLLAKIPEEYQQKVQHLIQSLEQVDTIFLCRYLMALQLNGYDDELMGAMLFYLNLIPDLKLFENNTLSEGRLSRNKRISEKFNDSQMGLLEKINSFGLRPETIQMDLFRFLKKFEHLELKEMGANFLLDRDGLELTFEKWPFLEEPGEEVPLEITLEPLPLPKGPDDIPVLNLNQERNLKIRWKVLPANSPVLDRFTIVGLKDEVEAIPLKRISKQRRTHTYDFSQADLEDGIYTIRINALSTAGDTIASDISEPFIVESAGEEILPPPPRKETFTVVNNIYEAQIKAILRHKRDNRNFPKGKQPVTVWETSPQGRRQGISDVYKIKFGRNCNYRLSVVPFLKRIEIDTLDDPQSLGRWQLDVRNKLSLSEGELELQDSEGLDYSCLEEFLEAREILFRQIIEAGSNEKGDNLIETCDITKFEQVAIRYVDTYLSVLARLSKELEQAGVGQINNLTALHREITAIDTVKVIIGTDEASFDVFLMQPTHPLKICWYLQYARMFQSWAEKLNELSGPEATSLLSETDINKIHSLNYPSALLSDENLLINVDHINFFWHLFVQPDHPDIRALISEFKTVIGVRTDEEHFTTIGPQEIANKLERYLRQHPYITTLKINAVSPGSGKILIDALLLIQERLPELNYEVRFFSNEPLEKVGYAFADLMGEDAESIGKEAVDAFVTASRNALFPKLVFSKHRLDELNAETTEEYEAHITLLFDYFPTVMATRGELQTRPCSFLNGLLNEYATEFSTFRGKVTWSRQVNPNLTPEFTVQSLPLAKKLYTIYQRYNGVLCSLADAENNLDKIPTVQLELKPEQANLIQRVHHLSDWVFTVDRNFGIEYLDNPFDQYCNVYLIDYVPEYVGDIGHRMIISTESLTEIQEIVRPAAERFGISVDDDKALLDILKSISGRLTLKLLSSPTKAGEAISMALARLFLEQTGHLESFVLIPLDSHLDIVSASKKELKDIIDSEISLKRTDFALISMDAQAQQVWMNLIEIKYRTGITLDEAQGMKENILQQLGNTEEILKSHFEVRTPDRFDRGLKTKELSTLIDFYLERAHRHRIISAEGYGQLRQALLHLQHHYTLYFDRHCLIFCLDDSGYWNERDQDCFFHYIGKDMIQTLLNHWKSTEPSEPVPLNTSIGYKYENPLAGMAPPKTTVEEKGEEGAEEARPEVEEPAEVPGAAPVEEIEGTSSVPCDIFVGCKHTTPQFGLLGTVQNRRLGLDLNGCNTISLFGVQGSGKSYTMGAIIEMSLMQIPKLNQLHKPLASIVFHYSKDENYRPEFISLITPNDVEEEIKALKERYDVSPQAIEKLVVLVPESKVDIRKQEYPGIEVHPLHFDPSELRYENWEFLMGIPGSEAMYVREMKRILRSLSRSEQLSLERIRQEIEHSNLSRAQKQIASIRLQFAREYLREQYNLVRFVVPGQLTLIDLRDEMIDKIEAMQLFMILLEQFANVKNEDGTQINKLIVLDEAHKYLHSDFKEPIKEVIREMRHRATSILISSQDPLSVESEVIELSSMIVLHKMTSPAWLKHIQKANAALSSLRPSYLNLLQKGQAYLWSKESTDSAFESQALKVTIRPRVTKHGGATITALG